MKILFLQKLEWKPLNNIKISQSEKETTVNLLENLENDDDVQNVYTNLKFGKKLMLILELIQEFQVHYVFLKMEK